jgi:Tfp pilus assembly protein FimV
VTAEYEVRSGDNLWDIAGRHTSADRDVRNTIEAIKRVNHLENSTIHPGQVLEIPLASSS